MPQRDSSPEFVLPDLSYGSIWLVGAGNGDPDNLSPLALHALGTADAVVHDPGVSSKLLDLVKPPHYGEAAAPVHAVERAIKLAQDGWRVVYFIDGNATERAVESVLRSAARDIPLRIVPSVGEPIDSKAPLGFLLLRKSVSLGRSDPRSSLVLVVTAPQAEATPATKQREPPLGFSMSGLAG
jgi:uroporphyrin-III C-methyltransferase